MPIGPDGRDNYSRCFEKMHLYKEMIDASFKNSEVAT